MLFVSIVVSGTSVCAPKATMERTTKRRSTNANRALVLTMEPVSISPRGTSGNVWTSLLSQTAKTTQTSACQHLVKMGVRVRLITQQEASTVRAKLASLEIRAKKTLMTVLRDLVCQTLTARIWWMATAVSASRLTLEKSVKFVSGCAF